MGEIKIMLVEDHNIFRSGLKQILQMDPELRVVGEAEDGESAVKVAGACNPDIILMDINLPKQNGLQATRQIKAKQPGIGVIVLTAYHDDEQLLHALQSGASAYYPKDVLPQTLLGSIHEVDSGNFVVGDQILPRAQVANWMLQQFEELQFSGEAPEDAEVTRPLTDREMEILRHIARGLSNKEIARVLDISQQTVKNHMTSILRRLAVNDRTQAAVLALKRGWIRLQDA